MLILQRWQHLHPLMEQNHLKLLLNHQLVMPLNQSKKWTPWIPLWPVLLARRHHYKQLFRRVSFSQHQHLQLLRHQSQRKRRLKKRRLIRLNQRKRKWKLLLLHLSQKRRRSKRLLLFLFASHQRTRKVFQCASHQLARLSLQLWLNSAWCLLCSLRCSKWKWWTHTFNTSNTSSISNSCRDNFSNNNFSRSRLYNNNKCHNHSRRYKHHSNSIVRDHSNTNCNKLCSKDSNREDIHSSTSRNQAGQW